MIKPRSAIARIGVGLAIVAGLSMGAPAASFAQEEFDTSQVSSITQNADTGITTCTNNADKAFSFQCAGTSATGYRQKDDSSSLYLDIQGYTGNPLRLYTDGAYNTSGSGSMNCTQGTYRSNHKGQWEMYNLVRENGRSAARLTAWASLATALLLVYGAPTASGISASFPHSCLKWLPSGFLGRKGEEYV